MSHFHVGGVGSNVRGSTVAGRLTGRRRDPGGGDRARLGRDLTGGGDRCDGLEASEGDEGDDGGEKGGREDETRLDGDPTKGGHQLDDVGAETRQLAAGERRRLQTCVAPRAHTSPQTRSHPEMVGDMSRVTLNFDLSKIPFVHF